MTPGVIFFGGGASREVIAKCWARLSAGGRIVVHAVTLETELVLTEAFKNMVANYQESRWKSRRPLDGELA